ncbi:MAG: hypothetical protein M1819_002178 [Sarea resinae]|nr:MAG: hypothetical protein M1819_002178 [Sarea resinae]
MPSKLGLASKSIINATELFLGLSGFPRKSSGSGTVADYSYLLKSTSTQSPASVHAVPDDEMPIPSDRGLIAEAEPCCSLPKRKNHGFPFEYLPPELLMLICSHLTLSSKAALALSSQFLLGAMGSHHLRRINRRKNYLEKESFLKRLQRDMTGFKLCEMCFKLHPMRCGGPHLQSKPVYTKCVRKAGVIDNRMFGKIRYVLKFQHVRLVTQRDMLRPDYGIRPEELFWNFDASSPHLNGNSAQLRVRVVGKELLCRAEFGVCIPLPDQPERLQRKDILTIAGRFFDSHNIELCPHLSTGTMAPNFVDGKLSLDLLFMLRQLRIGSDLPACEEGVQRCHCCHTEYQISNERFEDRSIRLTIVAWMNYGSGKSFTDLKWVSHQKRNAENESVRHQAGFTLAAPGAIKAAYEGTLARSLPRRPLAPDPSDDPVPPDPYGPPLFMVADARRQNR